MSDFDELLQRVLSEDANIVPPEGIERRIRRALTMKAKPFPIGRRLWLEAASAAILFCVAGSLVSKRWRPPMATAPPPKQVAMAKAAIGPMSFPVRAAPGMEARQISNRAWVYKTVGFSRRQTRIVPLEIEPLVVQPIEIASLTSNNSTEKREIR